MEKVLTTARRVEQAAYDCVGCPFVPGGRDPRYGLDCLGLVLHALKESCPDPMIRHRLGFTQLSMNVMDARNLLHSLQWLWRVHDGMPRPGSVILFEVQREAHLAIFGGMGIIHASQQVGQVVMHSLDQRWAKRTRGVFDVEWPPIDYAAPDHLIDQTFEGDETDE